MHTYIHTHPFTLHTVLMAANTVPFAAPLWQIRKAVDGAYLALLALEEAEESLRSVALFCFAFALLYTHIIKYTVCVWSVPLVLLCLAHFISQCNVRRVK
jgi:hypothetical protein